MKTRSVRKSILLAIAALVLSPRFSLSVPEDPPPPAAGPPRPALTVRSNLIRKGPVLRRPAGTRSSGAPLILSNGIGVDDQTGPGTLPERDHWIVRFSGPIREEWTVPLRSLGGVPLAYLPDDALIVRAGREAMEEIRRSSGVEWVAPFEGNQKLAASLFAVKEEEIVDAVALLFDGDESAGLENAVAAAGGEIVDRSERLIRFRGGPAALDEIARLDRVRWIEPWRPLTRFNNDCQWVVQSDLDQVRSVWEHGLRGEGVLLSLCDSGIRPTHEMFRDESRAIGGYGDYPDHRKVVAYRKAADSPFILFGDDPGAQYHGTHTACTLAGNDSTLGGSDRDGIAPDARIFFVDGGGDENVIYTPVDLADLFLPVYEGNGAGAPRIMSNSWGTLGGGEYDYRCEQVDRFDLFSFWGTNRREMFESLKRADGGMAVLEQAKREGLIGAIGITTHAPPPLIIEFLKEYPFECVTLKENILYARQAEVLDFCRENGIGVVVMSPLAGGVAARPSEEIRARLAERGYTAARLALRFLTSSPGVTSVIGGFEQVSDVEDDVLAGEDGGPLTDEERDLIADVRERMAGLGESFCTQCGYCMPCPNEVNIPGIFSLWNIMRGYGNAGYSRGEYAKMVKQLHWADFPGQPATACVRCGQCETKCPNDIPIMKDLRRAHADLAPVERT